MQLDKYHKRILKALGHYKNPSYTQLFQILKLEMPKRTFHKKLYELIDGTLVERDPPARDPTPHIGKRVKFKLTQTGKKTVMVQDTLLQFETEYQNILEKLVEHSLEIGRAEPLTGSTLYLASGSLPIFTIAHLPSKQQYEKLKLKLHNDANRQELGMLINRVIEFYTETIGEGLYHASYLNSKQAVFFMGFLAAKETRMIQELVDEGLFKNEYTLTRCLMKTTFFSVLNLTYNKLKTSRKFREGKEGIIFTGSYYYNPETMSIEPLPLSKTSEGVES